MKGIFRFAMLLSVAASLFSCKEKQEPEAGVGLDADFYITSSKDVIKSDGVDYAEIKVILQGEDVTASATIYGEDNRRVELIDGNRFVALKDGKYKFWAEYGTYITYNKDYEDSGLYTIEAISQDVPQPVLPGESDSNNLNFLHRAFLVQFTGAGCVACPHMIHPIKQLKKKGYVPSRAVHVAVHSYNNPADEAYITRPSVMSYPTLKVDMYDTFSYKKGVEGLALKVDSHISESTKAGLSVSPCLYETEGLVLATVSVKAAVDGVYKVGAWLLEDNIFTTQNGAREFERDKGYAVGEFDWHENCVRVVGSDYMGKLIGPMNAGQIATKSFVLDIDYEKWTKKKSKEELLGDLHLAVFVSCLEKNSAGYEYHVCNAVDCPIDSPTPFEYK